MNSLNFEKKIKYHFSRIHLIAQYVHYCFQRLCKLAILICL